MAKNKTTQTNENVSQFINSVESEKKRVDSLSLIDVFEKVSGFPPKMWGPSIIGFGSYHYRYESGHEGDAPLAAFSPRKDALVLYFSPTFNDKEALLPQLGKHKSSKACVYVRKLEDIDVAILEKMIVNSMDYIKALYPAEN